MNESSRARLSTAVGRAINSLLATAALRRRRWLGQRSIEALETRTMLTATPLTFRALAPLAGGVFDAHHGGTFSGAAQSEQYEVTLDHAGLLSVAATTADTSLPLRVRVTDDADVQTLGSADAPSAGGAAVIQNLHLAAGTYLIDVEDPAGFAGAGDYSVDARVNSSLQPDPSTNAALASATDISGSAVTLANGGERLAVGGTTASGAQYFKVQLAAGQFLSATLAGAVVGTGNYGDPQTQAVLAGAVALATGDFNGDGQPDLVVVGPDHADPDAGKIDVLLSTGTAGQYDISEFDTDLPGTCVAVGDFNKDGNLDVYVGEGDATGGASLEMFGDGEGNFDNFVTSSSANPVTAVVAVDLNNDGFPELVVGHKTPDGTEGELDGPGFGFYGGPPITSLAAGDFNHDGNQDVLIGYGGDTFFGHEYGDGTGFFPGGDSEQTGSTALAVAAADINGDGIVDQVVLYNQDDGSAIADVSLYDSSGNVMSETGYYVADSGFGPGASLVVSDLNGDGVADLVASKGPSYTGQDGIVVILSDPTYGQFALRSSLTITQPGGIALVDVNGTGIPDLVATSAFFNATAQAPTSLLNFFPDTAGASGGDVPSLALLDAAGNVLTTAGSDSGTVAIPSFIAPTAGTYYFRVTDSVLGRPFELVAGRGAALGLQPEFFKSRTQDVTGAKDVIGSIDAAAHTSNYYSIGLNAGDTITLTATALAQTVGDTGPFSIGLQFNNPGGQGIAFGGDGSPVTYTVPAGAGGLYTFFVLANSGAGTYDVTISGATGAPPPLTVSGTSIGPTGIIAGFPLQFALILSQPVLASSVQPSDFLVNGHPATDVRLLDDSFLYFDISSSYTGDGSYTVTMPAGSVLSTSGAPLAAYSATFTADSGPRVTSSTLTTGQTIASGAITENLVFSKPLLTDVITGIFGYQVLDPSDATLVNTTTGISYSPTFFQLRPNDAGDYDDTHLTITYGNLPDGQYELRLLSGDQHFEDENQVALNGSPSFPLPSGGIYPGGDFVLDFTVDEPAGTALPPLLPLAPLGTQMYQTAPLTAAVSDPTDVDTFSLAVNAGQQLSALLKAVAGSFQPQLELLSPTGTVLATVAAGSGGNVALLQNFVAPTGGTYTLRVTSLGGTGGYTIQAQLGAEFESEFVGGASNDTATTAQPLDFASTTSTGNVDRAGVIGASAGTNADYYSLTLTAGQRVSLAANVVGNGATATAAPVVAAPPVRSGRVAPLTGSGATPKVSAAPQPAGVLELVDAAGNVLAIGTAVGTNYYIEDFAAPAAGTYYVKIVPNGSYNLLATRGASIEVEPNDAPATQDISRTGKVTGYITSGDDDSYTFTANAGDVLTILTALPGDNGGGGPANGLQTVIRFYGPDGTQLSANQGSAPGDTHGSYITYTVPAGGAGTYRVSVQAAGATSGTYVLSVGGATGAPLISHPTITSSTPTNGLTLAAAPTQITLKLSEAIDPTTLNVSDLVIDGGGTVTAARLLDGSTVQFDVTIPNVTQTFNVTLAAGAFTSLQGQASAAYAGTVSVDRTGPHVVSQSPITQASAPFSSWTFTFSEPLFVTNPFDYSPVASISGPGGSYVSIVRVVISGNTLTVQFAPQTVGGTYTIVLSQTIKDLVGNPMDQNANGINGQATDTYTATVNLVSPDLTVTSVVPAANPTFGSTLDVTYTVKNTGTDAAADGWVDRIYLSPTPTLDVNNAVLLGTYGSPTVPLGQGASYTATQTVTLPLTDSVVAGNQYIIVFTNATRRQAETDTTNDVGSAAVNVALPPIIDLAASNVTGPVNLVAGQTAVINWTLRNVGNADFSGTMTERVALSSDNAIGNDTDLIYVNFTGNVAAGASVARTASITVPAGISGQRWFVVQEDAFNAVFEHAQKANNYAITAAATNVTLNPAPDLFVQSITVPTGTVSSGGPLTINWTLVNQGTSDFNGSFDEQVYLTNNADASASDYFTTVRFSGPIPVGGTVQRTATINLPSTYVGDKYAVVVTDASNEVFENPTGEANNLGVSATKIHIVQVPLPDLTVTNVTSPATAVSNGSIPITWTDTNLGPAAISGTWTDNVYLSTSPNGANAQYYGSFPVTATLAAGGSLTRTISIALDAALSGTFYAVVQTDAGSNYAEANEANNFTVAAASTLVTIAPYPDLIVTSVVTPPTGFSSQTLTLNWFVKNTGTGPTSSPQWYDRVYLSNDNSLDNQDTYLGDFLNPGYLDAGQSYQNSATVGLPAGVQGTYYLIVVADYYNSVNEFGPSGEANNTKVSSAVQVTLTPPPDLQVVAVQAPSQAFSGNPLTVAFDVRNTGPGATLPGQTQWFDTVYLSKDAVLDNTDVRVSGYVEHDGALAPGADYIGQTTLTLPVGISGPYYLIVSADAFNQVFENGFDDNTKALPINVSLQPPPDLVVKTVTAPTAVQAGHSLTVAYSVSNDGASPTPNDNWVDSLYLSPTPTVGAGAILIGQRTRYGALVTGDSYASTLGGQAPFGLTGTYYAVVVTDDGGQVFEVNRANNSKASAATIAVTSAPADLVVSNVSVPTTLRAGAASLVSFTVTNQGAGDTVVNNWYDRVYLSQDSVLGDGDDTLIGESYHSTSSPLGAGGTYLSANQPILVPTTVPSGTYYVLVKTDDSNYVYEGTALATGELNNVSTPQQVTVTRNAPDLQVTAVGTPGTLQQGQSATFSWTVRNAGDGVTGANFWYDDVYLSKSATYDNSSVLVARVQHTNALNAGDSYGGSTTLNVPQSFLPGTYYVLVYADSLNQVNEPAAGAEQNNLTASNTFTLTAGPRPNLGVTNVSAPASALAGQALAFNYTVKNTGNATAGGSWFDTVYLSLDQTLDVNLDIPLGTVQHDGGLAAGASYTQPTSFAIPNGVAGSYYVFVVTDSSNRVINDTNPADNTAYSPAAVNVRLPAPTDVAIGTVTLPAPPNASLGLNLTINYTVQNLSTQTAQGSWQDAVYLSTDPTYDAGDALLGTVTHVGDVGAGGSYNGSLTGTVPGLNPGNYYVIVRTDIRNALPESTKANNVGASLGQVSLSLPTLTPGVASTGTLTAGQSIYYKIDVPYGQTLYVTLNASDANAANELYLRYGQVPTRAQFDQSYSKPLAANQTITVPLTRAGTYYLLAYAAAVPSGSETYTLTGSLPQFSVNDTTYSVGGTAGQLTIQVNGAKFDRTVTATLHGNNQTYAAAKYYYVDAGRLYATFDLTHVIPGSYDVVLSNSAGQTATVSQGLTVVLGGGAHVVAGVSAPSAVKHFSTFSFSTVWKNDGLDDGLAPLLEATADTAIGRNPLFLTAPQYTFFAAAPGDGPAGILRPGQAGSQVFYAGQGGGSGINVDVGNYASASSLPFDYDSLRDQLIEPGENDAQFQAAFDRMKQDVGATFGQVLVALAHDATLLPAVGIDNQIETVLLQVDMDRARAEVRTSISGSVFAPEISVKVAGVSVTATNRSTGQVFVTTSYNDGSFVFPTLTAGTYDFAFDGALVTAGNGVTVAAGQHVTGAQLTLSAGEGFFGVVRDAASRVGIDGASVTIVNVDGTTIPAVADADGNYSFAGLAEGPVTLYADAAGYGRAYEPFTPQPGLNPGDFSLAPEARISLSVAPMAGNTAAVSVTARLDSQPGVAGIFYAVQVGQAYTFAGLPAGSYTIEAGQDGAATQVAHVTVTAGNTYGINAIQLAAVARIAGSVTATDPAIPVGGIQVQLLLNGVVFGSAQTDPSGLFDAGELPGGTYTLHVVAPLGFTQDKTVTVAAGQTLSNVQLPILAGDTLSGTVTSSLGGGVIAGAVVTVLQPGGSVLRTSAGENGTYVVKFLAPGVYTVSAPGATPVTVTLATANGSTGTANLSVGVAATITGHLRVAGSPVTGSVVLFENGHPIGAADTDSSGAYVLPLTLAGSYTLVALADNASFAPVSINATGNLTQDFNAGTGTLTVHLTDGAHDVTTDQLYVQLLTSGGPVGTALGYPAADGTLVLSNLAAGQYSVSVFTSSGEVTLATVTLPAGTGASASVGVSLDGGATLSGHVTGTGGAGASAVAVFAYASGGSAQIGATATAADGSYSLAGLPAGTYDLVIIGSGLETKVVTGVVVGAGGATKDLVVSVATSHLTGLAVDASGNPMSAGIATVTDAAGRELGSATLNADGTFVINGVSGTNLTVTVVSSGYRAGAVTVATAPGGTSVAVGTVHLTAIALPSSPNTTPAAGAPAAAAAVVAAGSAVSAKPALFDPVGSAFSLVNSVLKSLSFTQDVENQIGSDFDYDPNHVFLDDIPGLDQCKTLTVDRNQVVHQVNLETSAYTGALAQFRETQRDVRDTNIAAYYDLLEQAGIIAQGIVILDGIIAGLTLLAGAAEGVGVLAAGTTDSYVVGFADIIGPAATRFPFQLANALTAVVNSLYGLGTYFYQISHAATIKDAGSGANQVVTVATNVFGIALGLLSGIKNLSMAAHVGGVGGINSIAQAIQSFQSAVVDKFSMQDFQDELANLQNDIDTFNASKQLYRQTVQASRQSLLDYEVKLNQAAKNICDPQGNVVAVDLTKKFVPYPSGQDPNDIAGPSGFGPDNVVSAKQPLNYQIEFENEASATAPAQVVKVTQDLDPSLDVRTFRLGTMVLAGHVITPPDNVAFFQTRLDFTADLGVDVDVFAGVDVTTHQAFWTFTAIDPATGLTPVNPLVGLLPPDVTAPQGQGFVNYTIAPLLGVATGTVIAAQATIVFDTNAPIDTPRVTNKLDLIAPTSGVGPLPTSSAASGFEVDWSGSDDAGGSAIATYTIYVSTDGGAFTPWLTDTTASSGTYAGTPGHTYAFYSVATDNAGNVQATPTAAQATTSVPGAQATLTGLAGAVTATYGAANVTFTGTVGAGTVHPLAGEVVHVTLNGFTVDATPDGSGRFAATFDTSSLPASQASYEVTYAYAGDALLGSVTDTVSSTLTINAAPLTVTVTGGSKVYGSADPTFTATVTGYVNGQTAANLGGSLVIGTSEPATGNAPVGSYAVTASGFSSSNYAITYVPGTLIVTPAALTVTAVGGTKIYGQTVPALTATYAGFVGGDTVTSLTTGPTLSTAATAAIPVGSYAVTASGVVDGNYAISYVAGSLSVTRATPTLTLGAPPTTITYDGQADVTNWATAALTGATGPGVLAPSGAVTVQFFNGAAATGTPLASPPTDAGQYTVVATYAGDANYTAAASAAVTFTIARATPTLSLPPAPTNLVANGTASVTSWVSATITGVTGAPPPTGKINYVYYAGSAAAGRPLPIPPTRAGTYTVVASYIGNSNFAPAASAPVTFTIGVATAGALQAGLQVNDGSAQRSMVNSLQVSFPNAVTLGAGAITLTDSGGAAVPFTLSTTDNATYTLTFSGAAFVGGSLANGRYTLVVHAALVTGPGNAAYSGDQTFGVLRFFGDANGDGTVNNADYALFRKAYNTHLGQANYLWYFDADGNGSIDSADYTLFQQDQGTVL